MALKNSVETQKRSVVDDIAALKTLASKGLGIHPERCVRLRNRHASCRRCADVCTSGAISVEDGEWRMRPELCVGCGTCATMCPTCALEAGHPNDAYLMRQARACAQAGQGMALFACQQVDLSRADLPGGISAESAVDVVCLSRIEESLIFSLLAQGVDHILALHGQCENCPRRQGLQAVECVSRTVQDIAQAWGLAVDYRVVEAPHGAERTGYTPIAEYLSAYTEGERVEVQSDGAVVASFKPVHVQKDGTLPHFVPSRRLKLLDALDQLGDPAGEELDTRLWGHVRIDFGRCKSCKMCAVFCPTGAICKYSEGEGVVGIEHYLAECVHCCLCQDICPAGAITSDSRVPVRALASHTTERYCMPDPDWMAGPNQILQRMKTKIGGNSVEHSY